MYLSLAGPVIPKPSFAARAYTVYLYSQIVVQIAAQNSMTKNLLS